MILEEQLLEADEAVEPGRPLAHVSVHDAGFLDVEVGDVEDRRDPELPVAGLEGGVPVEQLERDDEVLVEEELIAPSENVGAVGIGGARLGRRGNQARLEEGVADRRQVHEGVLAEDGVIALDDTLVIRIPPVALYVGRLDVSLVAPPVRQAKSPPVGDRDEVGAGRRPALRPDA